MRSKILTGSLAVLLTCMGTANSGDSSRAMETDDNMHFRGPRALANTLKTCNNSFTPEQMANFYFKMDPKTGAISVVSKKGSGKVKARRDEYRKNTTPAAQNSVIPGDESYVPDQTATASTPPAGNTSTPVKPAASSPTILNSTPADSGIDTESESENSNATIGSKRRAIVLDRAADGNNKRKRKRSNIRSKKADSSSKDSAAKKHKRRENHPYFHRKSPYGKQLKSFAQKYKNYEFDIDKLLGCFTKHFASGFTHGSFAIFANLILETVMDQQLPNGFLHAELFDELKGRMPGSLKNTQLSNQKSKLRGTLVALSSHQSKTKNLFTKHRTDSNHLWFKPVLNNFPQFLVDTEEGSSFSSDSST